jgi:hypothetical protein
MTAMREQIAACLLLLLFLSVLGKPALAQDTPVSEADLKAAVLYNFTKYVEWPADAFASPEAPLVVGVYGDEAFTKTLRTLLTDKTAHKRGFTVKRLTTNAEAKSCHILFFQANETRRMGQLYDATFKHLPILTIGESDEFMEQGGMVNLFFEDKQVRFEVNPPTAENAKLTVSSRLLRLAKIRKGGAK